MCVFSLLFFFWFIYYLYFRRSRSTPRCLSFLQSFDTIPVTAVFHSLCNSSSWRLRTSAAAQARTLLCPNPGGGAGVLTFSASCSEREKRRLPRRYCCICSSIRSSIYFSFVTILNLFSPKRTGIPNTMTAVWSVAPVTMHCILSSDSDRVLAIFWRPSPSV